MKIADFITARKHIDGETENSILMKHNGDSITLMCPSNIDSVQFHRVDIKKYKQEGIWIKEAEKTEITPSDFTLQTAKSKTITLIEGGGDDVDMTITLTSWHTTDEKGDVVNTPPPDGGDVNSPPPKDNDPTNASGLIAGVVIGVILVLGIVVGYWYFFIHRKAEGSK